MTNNDPFLVPEDVYKELVMRGEEWADTKSAYDLLHDLIKVVKAEVFLSFKGENTISGAEQKAYASPEYREAITNSAEAGRKANRARVRYDAAKSLFDARRTAEASHRAAMPASRL